MKQITCPHYGDTYPDFDVSHVCSKGPYAPRLKPKMNELIKELAEQAGVVYHTRLGAETNIVELEEFTRALLSEVIRKITEEQTAVDAYWFCNDGYLIAQKLRQHFGVA